MRSAICFADKARGVYASNDGLLYLTEPGTNKLTSSPIMLPNPFHIIVNEEYDPFVIVFTGNGYMMMINTECKKVVSDVLLPANIGVIDQIKIDKENETITLTSNHGEFVYNDHWTIISEPLDALTVNPDTKINSQIAVIENSMAYALENKDNENYIDSLKKYLLYIATYCSKNAFIVAWYDMVKSSPEFVTKDTWKEVVDLISAVDRISSLLDELNLAIASKFGV